MRSPKQYYRPYRIDKCFSETSTTRTLPGRSDSWTCDRICTRASTCPNIGSAEMCDRLSSAYRWTSLVFCTTALRPCWRNDSDWRSTCGNCKRCCRSNWAMRMWDHRRWSSRNGSSWETRQCLSRSESEHTLANVEIDESTIAATISKREPEQPWLIVLLTLLGVVGVVVDMLFCVVLLLSTRTLSSSYLFICTHFAFSIVYRNDPTTTTTKTFEIKVYIATEKNKKNTNTYTQTTAKNERKTNTHARLLCTFVE